MLLTTTPHVQYVAQGQFFKLILSGLESELSFT